MDEPETRSKGVAIIIDVKDLSWNIMRWFTPSLMKIGSRKMDLFPCKELIYHIVNTSMFVNMLTKLVWPFLPARVTKKVSSYFYQLSKSTNIIFNYFSLIFIMVVIFKACTST